MQQQPPWIGDILLPLKVKKEPLHCVLIALEKEFAFVQQTKMHSERLSLAAAASLGGYARSLV